MTARGRNDALLYNLDLGPTLCDLLGIRTPEEWDGASFARAIEGKPFDGRPYLVYDHGVMTLSRAVRTRDWELVNVLHPGLFNYEGPHFLHDLTNDPHEQANLIDDRRDVYNELCGYMNDWRIEQVRKLGAPDPLESMMFDGPYIYYDAAEMEARFRRTGREHLVEDLRKRQEIVRKDYVRAYDQQYR